MLKSVGSRQEQFAIQRNQKLRSWEAAGAAKCHLAQPSIWTAKSVARCSFLSCLKQEDGWTVKNRNYMISMLRLLLAKSLALVIAKKWMRQTQTTWNGTRSRRQWEGGKAVGVLYFTSLHHVCISLHTCVFSQVSLTPWYVSYWPVSSHTSVAEGQVPIFFGCFLFSTNFLT